MTQENTQQETVSCEGRMLRPKQAAEYAGVCERTLRNWRKLGLECVRIVGVAGYLKADLDAFLEKMRRINEQPQPLS